MLYVLESVLAWIKRCPRTASAIAVIVLLDLAVAVSLTGLAALRLGFVPELLRPIQERARELQIQKDQAAGRPSQAALTLEAYRLQKPTGPTRVRVQCRMENGQDDLPYYLILLMPYEKDPGGYQHGWAAKDSPAGRFLWEVLKSGKDKKGDMILLRDSNDPCGPQYRKAYQIVEVIH
jgi:hypothetical protein